MPTSLVRGKYLLARADLEGRSRLLTDGAVVQRDGVILEVGPYADLRARHGGVEVLGNGRQFLLPGLVNAHHHGRGVSGFLMGQPDGPLETWIHRGWGRRPLDPRLMALYTLMQQIRSGTTTVMFNQSATAAARVLPEAEGALRAFQETGVRVAFSIAFRDQNVLVYGDDAAFLASLPPGLARDVRGIVQETLMPLDDYLALADDLAQRYAASNEGTIRIFLSPLGYHWCAENSLQRIADFARRHGLGVHTHLVETAYQRLYAERRYGQTPARRLHALGFLGPLVSLAHGVWLTQDDMTLLAETGTGVCHNPSSNLRLRSGIAPVLAMLRQGVTVALGTDSTALNDDDDMLQEMGLALRLHRPAGLEEQPVSADQVLHMATLGGARVTTFGDSIGALEPGRRADMVLVAWDRLASPYLDEEVDPLEALLARARARDVEAVMIDGRVVYQDGRFPGLDEEGIVKEIRDQVAGPVPETIRQRRRLAQELEPHIRRFYAGWELPAAPLYRYHSIR
ncbi:MAG: amidohydrolase family protein [Chloroflexi bacterium]|nr:amidohydrolase family protein [Chloroflexota bacterium]